MVNSTRNGTSKNAQLAENIDLYQRAAYSLAKAGNLKEAAVTLEKGRTRRLNDGIIVFYLTEYTNRAIYKSGDPIKGKA